MEKRVKYTNLKERAQRVAENEALGLRMLHDNFSPDWKPGDEPHGTLTFTDVMPPVVEPEPTRNLAAEIDQLKADIKKIKGKLKLA